MSTNVGAISIGMNVNLAEFQAGMTKATELARSNTRLMSAEMKRNSREGAESMRLIDEAIGVHISRPLTRIIGQTQILGPLLASVLSATAGIAIGTVLFEQGKRVLEMTGALEGWKDILGLTGPAAEEAAKQIQNADSVILKGLREKTEMQDVYNKLILGLEGSSYERAHLDLLKQETSEIQKQILLETAMVQARANEVGWRGQASAQAGFFGGPVAQGLLGALGINPAKDMMAQQIEANKLAEAMKPLFERLHEVQLEIQKGGWKVYADDAEEAKTKIAEAQKELKFWNDENNKALQLSDQALTLNDQIGVARQRTAPTFDIAPPAVSPQRADLAELVKLTGDQNAAWAKAAEVVNQIETPLEKYNTQLGILKTLEHDGYISAQQFAQAQQVLSEELAKATDKLELLLRRTGDARAGMQAFFMQLQKDSGRDGAFTFDLLNKGLQGFVSETTKALTGAQTSWKSFFLSLDQMAISFFEQKLIAQLLGRLGGLFGGIGGGGGGSWAGVGSGAITGFASGTDYAPGGMAWVGEQGPELVNLPRGSSVTPNSGLRGGPTVHVHIDARGGEIGVEEKISRAISESAPHIIMRAVVEASEIKQRSLT